MEEQNRTYELIYPFDENDLLFSDQIEKSLSCIKNLTSYSDCQYINDIITLFNICTLFKNPRLKSEIKAQFDKKKKIIHKILSNYISSKIHDDNILEIYKSIDRMYMEYFWDLFEHYRIYKLINESYILEILKINYDALLYILKHKKTVNYYDQGIASFMYQTPKSAELIISALLIKENDLYVPKSLNNRQIQDVLLAYLRLEQPNINFLQVALDAKSQTRFVLEDETKLKIKLRIEEEKERLLKDTIPFTMEYLIKFINYNEPRYCINHGSGKVELIFDIDWLTKNLDYATILNNFIHLFEYVDWNGRLAFISHSHDKKGLELALGMKNISDYDVSFAFQSKQLEVLSIMYAYYKFLEQHDIQLEKVVQWFLQEYLPNEFNIDGFKFHVPIESSSTLDKIRFLLPEMESILKQFDSYTKYKKVNWELLEISSNPLSVENIGSILNDKYIEINPEDKLCSNEMNWLFSDQSTLTFLDNSTKTWKESTAFLLFMNHSIALKDYKHRLQDVINWLISRNDLKINDKGFICLTARAMVLKLLYEGDVLNTYYYKDKKSVEQLHSVIQEMIKENEVIPYSSLLSRPEQDYFNYMLNEHTFGNGPKLRNKYIHASSKIDDKIQEQDYMYLLIILIGIIIKMNEEFCLYYPNSKESAIIWC